MINGHSAPPPRSQTERELERAQRTVTQGLQADERRKSLILELHRGGMSQVEIVARLDRASRSVGGDGVTEDSINKIVARSRRKVRTT